MKQVKRMMIFLFSLGMLYVGIVFVLILSGTNDTPSNFPNTVLILGAQVKGKTKAEAYPSTVLKERLNTAVPYLKKYPKAIAIVCGGQGEDEPDSEANVMAAYLIKHGIPKEQIIKESQSTRTKENLINAQEKRPLGKTVIVSSDFHIYRSKLLAKRLGITKVTGLPAPSQSSAKVKSYVREVAALSYGLLFDW